MFLVLTLLLPLSPRAPQEVKGESGSVITSKLSKLKNKVLRRARTKQSLTPEQLEQNTASKSYRQPNGRLPRDREPHFKADFPQPDMMLAAACNVDAGGEGILGAAAAAGGGGVNGRPNQQQADYVHFVEGREKRRIQGKLHAPTRTI